MKLAFLALVAAAAVQFPIRTMSQPSGTVGEDKGQSIQAEIDRVARAGGGVVQLERGMHDIASPLYLRSNVILAGRGRDTVIRTGRLSEYQAWRATAIFGGNMTPGSYSEERGEGYLGRPVRRLSERDVALENCDARQVAGLSSQVVWLSSSRRIAGFRGRPKPLYGEVTAVEAVSRCRIRLADPIGVPPGEQILLHWSDRSRSLPIPGFPNEPIRNAGVRDLQIVSERGNALLISGCYRCAFTNLHIGNTRRLLPLEGVRRTTYRNIRGFFNERGIEVAMFAKDNLVDGVVATYRPEGAGNPRPAIRFGEYARDNVIRNVTFNLGRNYLRRDRIRFDESAGNRLENIRLFLPAPDNHRPFVYQGDQQRGGRGRLPPETVLSNVQLCFEGGAMGCVPIR